MARRKSALWYFKSLSPELQAKARSKYWSTSQFKKKIWNPIIGAMWKIKKRSYTPIDMNVWENTWNIVWPYWFNKKQQTPNIVSNTPTPQGTYTPQGTTNRASPTVATVDNPLINQTFNKSWLDYDPNNPQDYIFKMNAKIWIWEKPTQDELYNFQKAQFDLNKINTQSQTGMEDPYQKYIAEEQAKLQAQQEARKIDNEKLMDTRKKELEARYNILRQEQTDAWARERDVAQSSTSFSWFGRSTFNADQQVDIQKRTDKALSMLNAQQDAELQAYKMQLEGASSEDMKWINDQIAKYRELSAQFKADAIKNASEMSKQAWVDYMQTLNNLMETASKSWIKYNAKQIEQQALAMQWMSEEQKQEYLQNLDPDTQLLLQGLSEATRETEADFTPKMQKIWKNSYGYRDPKQKKFVNAWGGSYGGWGYVWWWGGWGWGSSYHSAWAWKEWVGGVTIPSWYSDKYSESMLPVYTAFIEWTRTPTQSQIKALWGFDNFVKDANRAYLDNQNKLLASQWMQLTDPNFYVSMSKDDRKQFKKDSKNIRNATRKIDEIINFVNENWIPTNTRIWKWKILTQKIRDLQLALKWEWAYELWVLAWPDLDLLESIIPTPDTINKIWGAKQFNDQLLEAKKMFTNQINTANAWYWVKFAPKSHIKQKTVWDTVDSTKWLADWTIVEENGIEYVIKNWKPVRKNKPKPNVTQSFWNPMINSIMWWFNSWIK